MMNMKKITIVALSCLCAVGTHAFERKFQKNYTIEPSRINTSEAESGLSLLKNNLAFSRSGSVYIATLNDSLDIKDIKEQKDLSALGIEGQFAQYGNNLYFSSKGVLYCATLKNNVWGNPEKLLIDGFISSREQEEGTTFISRRWTYKKKPAAGMYNPAVTNKGKINFLVDKKFISAEVAYAKAIELSWLDSAIYIANSASNTAWHAEVASKAADKIIAAAVGDLQLTSHYQVMKNAMLDNGKYLLLTDTTSTLATADKLIAAEKWVAASVVLFSYQAKACQEKRIEAVNAKYLDTIYAKLASGEAGEFWNKFAYFDMLVTCYYTKDYDKLNNFPVPVLEKLFGDVRDHEVLAWNWTTSTTRPFSDQARAAALKSANISDKKRIAIASVADKVLGNKTSSTSIFEKITDKALKLQLALYLNDKDKIIDVFGSLDNSVDAKTLDESLTVINALDIDYRAAEHPGG